MKKQLSFIFILGLLAGCSTVESQTEKSSLVNPIRKVSKVNLKIAASNEKSETVFVFKYDGSAQCESGSIVSLDKMAQQLEGIKVYSQIKKSDGLMRIQLCGSPTGKANVFEISKKDIKKAKLLGFQIWKF